MFKNSDDLIDETQNSSSVLYTQQKRKLFLKEILPNLGLAIFAWVFGMIWYLAMDKVLEFDGIPWLILSIPGIFGLVKFMQGLWVTIDVLNSRTEQIEGPIVIINVPSRSRDGHIELAKKMIRVNRKMCKTTLHDKKDYAVIYLPISKLALSIKEM
jgi:hypothetical protein